MHYDPQQLYLRAKQEEARDHLPEGLLTNVLQLETNMGRYNRPSRTGALGVAQIMPSTGKQFGYTPQQLLDDDNALRAAGQILSHNYQVYHDPRLATAAYNAGIGGVRKYSQTGNLSDLPAETRNYLAKLDGLSAPANMPTTMHPESLVQGNAAFPQPSQSMLASPLAHTVPDYYNTPNAPSYPQQDNVDYGQPLRQHTMEPDSSPVWHAAATPGTLSAAIAANTTQPSSGAGGYRFDYSRYFSPSSGPLSRALALAAHTDPSGTDYARAVTARGPTDTGLY